MEDPGFIISNIKILALKEEAGNPREAGSFEIVKSMVTDTAKKMFMQKGYLSPASLLMFTNNGEECIGVFQLDEYFDLGVTGRSRAAEVTAQMAKNLGAYCVMFASSAITYTQPKGDTKEWTGVEDIPDSEKNEALVLTYEHEMLGSGILSAEVVRSGDKFEVKDFKEMDGDGSKNLGGRFSRLIPSLDLDLN